MGDFNELVSSDDKNFGTLSGRFGGLISCINRNTLVDMGYIGSKYTWTNNTTKERLDMGISYGYGRILIHEATIHHLPRLKLVTAQSCSNSILVTSNEEETLSSDLKLCGCPTLTSWSLFHLLDRLLQDWRHTEK